MCIRDRLKLIVPADDALDTLEALFDASVRSSIISGDANARDVYKRQQAYWMR